MEENKAIIKSWLSTGSINIFGLPYSGKDTVGVKLAELLGAKFLSSGLILRDAGQSNHDLDAQLSSGTLTPTDQFRTIVLPYFSRADIADYPLILSSVGRWIGEETPTIAASQAGNHPIKAALLLNISEADIKTRWQDARILQDRGTRSDDKEITILNTRIAEFNTKTLPVIQRYHDMKILIPINADQTREAVLAETITKLANFASASQ